MPSACTGRSFQRAGDIVQDDKIQWPAVVLAIVSIGEADYSPSHDLPDPSGVTKSWPNCMLSVGSVDEENSGRTVFQLHTTYAQLVTIVEAQNDVDISG